MVAADAAMPHRHKGRATNNPPVRRSVHFHCLGLSAFDSNQWPAIFSPVSGFDSLELTCFAASGQSEYCIMFLWSG